MNQRQSLHVVWSFGSCTLDERRLELTVDGEVVDIEARPMELLAFLLQHAGELVTKDELLEAVWPGRIPSESVLTKTIAKLRQALRDEHQSLIRTVYGQGYRLIADVSAKAVETAADPVELPALSIGAVPPQRPHWRLEERLSGGTRNDVWLARHDKTGQPRVFKFALDAEGLRSIKREVTVYRVLSAVPSMSRHLLEIIDWNLDERPCFIECPFVPGRSFAWWAEHEGADASQPTRLELVAQIADTLASAHDAGVLHKDIKPGNVLIDVADDGVPFARLCDFGSGRVIDLERLAQLEITRLGFTQTAMADDSSGTPLYLAPELLTGQAPTLRSDIYALGVMLYQAAVGDFQRPLAVGWEREVDDPLLCEDIAACADADPARRFADARELARRLRALDQRRQARRDQLASQAQHARLQVRLDRVRLRRPWLIAIAVLLLFGLAASTVLWRRAERANLQAEREVALTLAVNRFLTEDLLANADPLQAGRRDLPISDLLGPASERAATRFAGQPEAESAVRAAIGNAYVGLSRYDEGERELLRAIALLDGIAAVRDRQTDLRLALTWLYFETDKIEPAEQQIAELQARPPAAPLAALQFETLQAWRTFRKGDYDAGLAALNAQRPRYQALLATEPALAESFLLKLGEADNSSGHFDDAVPLFEGLLTHYTARYGARDARAITAMQALGASLAFSGRNDDALKILLEGTRIAQETLGANHDISLQVAGELAGVYDNLKRYDEAEALYKRVLETRLKQFGPTDEDARTMLSNLSVVYGNQHRYQESLAQLRRLYALESQQNGELHPRTLLVALNMGYDLNDLHRFDEAAVLLTRTLERARRGLPADDEHLGIIQYKLAEAQGRLGRTDEARANFDQAIAFLRSTRGDDYRLVKRATSLRDAVLGTAQGL
ncbi:hypothetical protein BH09PSE6_BH09PSE6_04570 [soil metagenome]